MLLIQQLYRKIVKKGEPTESNTVFNKWIWCWERLIRAPVNSSTVRFKVNDNIVLTGDVGVVAISEGS